MKEDTKVKQYEPKKKNRFIVTFPEEYYIDQWLVSNVTMPRFIFTNSLSENKGEWDNIKIECRDATEFSSTHPLYKIARDLLDEKEINLTFKIEVVDAKGIPNEDWDVEVSDVLEINFGDMDYDLDEIKTNYIIIKPLDCKLKEIK